MRWKWLLGGLAGIPILGFAGLLMAIAPLTSSLTGLATSGSCTVTLAQGVEARGWDAAQVANAEVIAGVALDTMHLPDQAAIDALAAAMQESGLTNEDHGSQDSLGLFQQRPSQGWGTPAQIMDPTYAATQFLKRLTAIPGWQTLNVGVADQDVQHSSDTAGDLYQRWAGRAQQLLGEVLGGGTPTCGQASAATATGSGSGGYGTVVAKGLPLRPLFPWVPAGGFPTAGYPAGQCTYFAAWQDHVTDHMGDGGSWLSSAQAAGIPTSAAPAAGDVVVFGVGHGYSDDGHVAVVVSASSSSFTVEEMNYAGLGVVDERVIPLHGTDILGYIRPTS